MRTFLYAVTLSCALTGCGSRSAPDQTQSAPAGDPVATDSVAAAPPAGAEAAGGCYRRVEGRDTTTLRLTITGTDVTGELAVLPYEKDRARGPIRGTRSGDQVRADWQRSGEGVTEPYEVVFTLRGDSVTWREGERVQKDGKWVLKDPGQGYQYALTRSACP